MNFILAGDAGATKTELALYKTENGKFKIISSERFISKEFTGLEEIIELFLRNKNGNPESVCIGIPGPVEDGKVKSTNLPWELDENQLSEKLNIKKFRLANDLEAIATSVPFLSEDDLIMLYKGTGSERDGNKAVLAPGTGLGQAALVYNNKEYIVVPTEGGHSDFAPGNEIETELLKFLQKKYDHVSYERLISGIGMINIFEFLKSTGKFDCSGELADRIEKGDSAAVISTDGLSKKSIICERTLDIFVSILGAQTGNMVLNYKATSGIYLAGGIPYKIIEKLKEGRFIQSFLNKGRLSYLCEMTPVYIVKNESAGTLGAAILATRI